MDCENFLTSTEFNTLVPETISSGMRVLSYEPKNWYKFVVETQAIEQVGPLPSDVRDGYNKAFYEGFYGYIRWYWGNTFTYKEYTLTIFFRKNEIDTLYLFIRKTQTPEDGCLYKVYLRNAFDTRCCPYRGWV